MPKIKHSVIAVSCRVRAFGKYVTVYAWQCPFCPVVQVRQYLVPGHQACCHCAPLDLYYVEQPKPVKKVAAVAKRPIQKWVRLGFGDVRLKGYEWKYKSNKFWEQGSFCGRKISKEESKTCDYRSPAKAVKP